MTESQASCIECGTELTVVDQDPNRTCGGVCARCVAEQSHDFDAEPDAVFTRAGTRMPTPRYRKVLQSIERLPQRQDSLNDQLRDLRVIANHFGLYDAADFIRLHLEGKA